MTQTEFETLAARFFADIRQVQDAPSLLRQACRLLEADVAVLIQRNESAASSLSVANTNPHGRLEWAEKQVVELRKWYAEAELPDEAPGDFAETPVTVGGENFKQALFAIGQRPPSHGQPLYELILLKKLQSDPGYSSYHAAIASGLLQLFEKIEWARQAREYESRLGLEELLQVDWVRFCSRIGSSTGADAKSPDPPDHDSGGVAFPEDRVRDVKDRIGRNGFDKAIWNAGLLIIKNGWRRMGGAGAAGARDLGDRPPAGGGGDGADDLLQLTARVASQHLARCRGASYSKGPTTRIDRDLLRVYFAALLCQAPNLRQRFLDPPKTAGGPSVQAAPEVRRLFRLNLARYMLGVVESLAAAPHSAIRLERGSLVKPEDFLDGLLHLVDRFAHVELGVDENLHIREHLMRAVGAEVRRHLRERHYRDHLLHVVDVFLLGHILLAAQAPWSGGTAERLIEFIRRTAGPKRGRPSGEADARAVMRDWAVAALLHDIDYQLAAAGDRLDASGAAESFFALSRPIRCDWVDMARLQTGRWEERLNAFASHCRGARDGWFPAIEKDEVARHGVMSALRVAQILAHVDCEAHNAPRPPGLPLMRSYRRALHAIAHHDLFRRRVKFQTHPLACLLRLCDELQEWGRRRVAPEHLAKHTYLQIEQDQAARLDAQARLEAIEANLSFSAGPGGDLSVQVSEPRSELVFRLDYSNPLVAQHHATPTFLSKAFNLQHIELPARWVGPSPARRWRLELAFPDLMASLHLTEFDIYGLLRDRIRVLPEIPCFSGRGACPPGLVWKAGGPQAVDRVVITVEGAAGRERRRGWQVSDPGGFVDDLVAIRQQIIRERTLSPTTRDYILNPPNPG
jgi:hypothetical protein